MADTTDVIRNAMNEAGLGEGATGGDDEGDTDNTDTGSASDSGSAGGSEAGTEAVETAAVAADDHVQSPDELAEAALDKELEELGLKKPTDQTRDNRIPY